MATYSNVIYIIIGLPDEIIVGGDQDMEFKKSSRPASVMPFVPIKDEKLRREEEKRRERWRGEKRKRGERSTEDEKMRRKVEERRGEEKRKEETRQDKTRSGAGQRKFLKSMVDYGWIY